MLELHKHNSHTYIDREWNFCEFSNLNSVSNEGMRHLLFVYQFLNRMHGIFINISNFISMSKVQCVVRNPSVINKYLLGFCV
jgi:hypothetical protein